jgi:hypothetical protein
LPDSQNRGCAARHDSRAQAYVGGLAAEGGRRAARHAAAARAQKIATTLDIYAHALPSMQPDAAQRLGALLYSAVSKP